MQGLKLNHVSKRGPWALVKQRTVEWWMPDGYMTTSWNGNLFPITGPLWKEFTGLPVNFPHKGQWSGVLKFSLICAWINDWVINRAHYDVIVMCWGPYRSSNELFCKIQPRWSKDNRALAKAPIVDYWTYDNMIQDRQVHIENKCKEIKVVGRYFSKSKSYFFYSP